MDSFFVTKLFGLGLVVEEEREEDKIEMGVYKFTISYQYFFINIFDFSSRVVDSLVLLCSAPLGSCELILYCETMNYIIDSSFCCYVASYGEEEGQRRRHGAVRLC